MAFASVLALGATALVAGAPAASASLPGSGNVLTTSNGSTSIRFYNDPSRTVLASPFDETMKHVAWSPDGSLASYVDPMGGISTLRWDGQWGFQQVPGESGTVRESPTWRGNGASLIWAEKPAGQSWRIRLAPSSSFKDFGNQLTPPGDSQHYRNPDGGHDHKVVFQRQADNGSGAPTGQSSVVLFDGSKPEDEWITVVDDNGSNPALSPDGTRVAFVRNGQIIVSDLSGNSEVPVTSNAGTKDNPVWSPDGRTIAFNQGSGVATAAANGTQAASPVVVSGATGVPAYQPRKKDRAVRLFGTSRFTTAAAVSQSHWKTYGNAADTREQAGAVVLSRSDTFADALGGSALAAAKQGPLLMTPPTSLEATTQAEIQRVLAPGGTVYLLGSPGALSTGVEDAVRALGYNPVRLAGTDRFSTSVAIANAIDPSPDLVLMATGMNYPDALAAGAAAGSYNYPGANSPYSAVVILTNEAKLPDSTRTYLDGLDRSSRTLVGIGRYAAQAAVAYDGPDAVEVWGTSRYETALYTAWTFFSGQQHVALATGANWPDALSGGALMGVLNGPLMLTLGTATDLTFEAELLLAESAASAGNVLILGSAPVISDRQRNQAGLWISGPLGATAVSNPIDLARTGGAAARTAATGEPGLRTPDEVAKAAESVRERLAELR
ncbi:cell wall-binding repeat-containing protein [Micromonospora cathayae]|uniref:Cell wall-binding repeat-containing protein n=1 Tax=Micromonospora cathayae TaxID=3028804 RepID=A0ABY7ZSX6_9ACTN|nr:cell wall-binding repeat-containing protein [Micromonospora sp. HUAS 3]WDZ86102.1 cell wall-binding repeat-containing protein [Micromonospora sp. HUAS 3]